MVEKCDFLEVVKIPCPKTRFLVTLRSFIAAYKFFPGRGLFPVSTFKEEFFNEKMSSLAGFKKIVIQFSAKVPILANFDYLGPTSKSIFSTDRQNFKKSSVIFLGEIVTNIVLNFGLSISAGLRGAGASRFASRLFPKSTMLVLLLFSIVPKNKFSIASNMVDFYSLLVN